MFHIIKGRDYEEISDRAFEVIRPALGKKGVVLGLATGSSPVGLYRRMVRDHQENGTSYTDAVSFNLDEYVGLGKGDAQSYFTFMRENLFDSIDIREENTHIPDGKAADPDQAAKDYEEMIRHYTVDVQVLGIGSDGHIGFNEPGTPLDSLTHVTVLKESTIRDNARFFEGDISRVPTRAITQGLATILRAKKILLIASGANKAEAVRGMIEGQISEDCPASILQRHPDVTVLVDQEAASKIR